jgi:DNA-binding LytR/AlgR family response regulator
LQSFNNTKTIREQFLIQINRNLAVNRNKISKVNTKESWLELNELRMPVGAKYLIEVSKFYKLISK